MIEIITYEKDMEAFTRWGHWKVTHDVIIDQPSDKPVECHKDITVNPGASLSAQLHWGRGETYIGLEGVTKIYVNGNIFELSKDDKVEIPRGSIHFSYNDSGEKSKFHEIQAGPLCDEADIMRTADRYKTAAELNTNEDVVGLMVKVARDRYESERNRVLHDKNDFMPDVIAMAEGLEKPFSDTQFINGLRTYFQNMVEKSKFDHASLTPVLNNEPIQKPIAK